MCGICGELNLRPGAPPSPDTLRAMCAAMRHRGPDDQGEYLNEQVALGMRRLSIIDLAGGHQPIHNEDETVWIVFNGEIYNYRALRRDLEQRGHRFYTSSDTEAIVHAYEEYGTDSVRRLNGIFAFAIWDTRQRVLFVGRDRMGVKPLFYVETPERLIFASELKTLLHHPAVKRRIDLVALHEYLTFEYVPTPRSMIEGVRKLPPGHFLTVRDGRVAVEQYWDLALENSEGPRQSDAAYELELMEQLRAAVSAELVSDVPVGVLLSGGLDSSAITLAAAAAYPGTLKTFSVAFEDPSFDESVYARAVARRAGTDHHELTVSAADLLVIVPELGALVDEPLGDSSFVPTYLLCRFTRQHVKVALGGDGGDELFAGYPTYQAHRLAEYYRRLVPGPLRRQTIPALVERLPTSFDDISLDFKLKRFVRGQTMPPGVRHHQWLGSFLPAQTRQLLQPNARVPELNTYAVVLDHERRCRAREPLNRVLYDDVKLYLEGDILQKTDRASMACSLEVRVPLLNHMFVEWAATVPHDQKLHGLATKWLFRKSLAPLLPPAITRRKKKGFNMPVAKWLAGPLRSLVEDTLGERRLREEGIFEPTYVRRLLDQHYAHRADHRKLLWTLLVYQLWYQQLRALPAPAAAGAARVG